MAPTPVDVLARFVLANVEGITFQWLVNRDTEQAPQVLDVLAAHLIWQADLTSPTRRSTSRSLPTRP